MRTSLFSTARFSTAPFSTAAALTALVALSACPPPPPVSLEGTDLVATFGDDRTTLAIAFVGLDVESGECPTIDREGITFAGAALLEADVQVGGSIVGEAGCGPIGINTAVAANDPPEDGELVITSGGGTVRWVAQGLLATRRFVRAGDTSDQVPRGSIVRINHEPITDLLGEPESVVLNDDAELALTFRLDVDGIIVDIPGAASPGPQTLDLTVPVEVPALACEGFASCTLEGPHFEQIPITIAP